MAQRVLENRRILLTGASRGIGRELALELARQHARLLVIARSEPALRELVVELNSQGAVSADCLAGDVTDPTFRGAILEYMAREWGEFDVLINNAGVSAHGRFARHEEQVLRQIMEVNFYAATELTRSALPLLTEGEDPLIVNVCSILGHRGMPYNSEYSASKFALRGWSEAIRTELHSRGIEVLVVSPGTTDTDFFDHLLTKTDSLPWGKQKGIAPEAVARQVRRAMQLRRTEIYPNWRGRLLVAVNRWVPGLLDRVMKRFG